MNAIEERRLEDMERTERKNAEAQKKLEQILNRHVAFANYTEILMMINAIDTFQGFGRRQVNEIPQIRQQQLRK